MNTEKLGLFEGIAIICLSMISRLILNTPKEIISRVGSAAWLNIIYISIFAILISWFIASAFKNFKGKDILDISKFVGGSWLKSIMGIIYILLFLLTLLLILKNAAEILQLIYFRNAPILYIFLFFIISIALSTKFSLRVISKTTLIVFPLLLFSIIVILISAVEDFVPQTLFPILGYGAKETFLNGLSNIYCYTGIFYLLFINPFLNRSEDLKKISIISIIISSITLLSGILCLTLTLSFTFGSSESFPFYLLARHLEFGRFFQRADAIFIFIWIMSAICYSSATMYFCLYIFKKITNTSSTTPINYTFCLLLLGILSIPTTSATFIINFAKIFNYASLIILFGISLLILIIGNLKFKHINKKKGTNNGFS